MALIDNLQAFWELGEASGTRNDSHSTNHLTDINTVGSAAGKVGTAADFEFDSSEYLSIADNAALSMGDIDFSIALWVYLESKPAADNYILCKYETGTNSREYAILRVNATPTPADRFRFQVSLTGSSTLAGVSATTFGAPALTTWYFIVAWHSAGANTLNIQINDGTVDSVSHTGGAFSGTAPFQLGAVKTTVAALFFDGMMDQVGVWKRVLTSDEKTFLYNSGNGRSYAEIVTPPGGFIPAWALNSNIVIQPGGGF